MSSHTTVFEQISSKLLMEILFGATSFRTTGGDKLIMCLCQEIRF